MSERSSYEVLCVCLFFNISWRDDSWEVHGSTRGSTHALRQECGGQRTALALSCIGGRCGSTEQAHGVSLAQPALQLLSCLPGPQKWYFIVLQVLEPKGGTGTAATSGSLPDLSFLSF